MAGIRGLWFGFYRGFFHDSFEISPLCLGGKVEDQIVSALQFFAYGSVEDLFQVADDVTSLYFDNKDNCRQSDFAFAV